MNEDGDRQRAGEGAETVPGEKRGICTMKMNSTHGTAQSYYNTAYWWVQGMEHLGTAFGIGLEGLHVLHFQLFFLILIPTCSVYKKLGWM